MKSILLMMPGYTGNRFTMIQISGGFFNGYHISDPNIYVVFDELKIIKIYGLEKPKITQKRNYQLELKLCFA